MRVLMLDNEFPPLGGGTGVVNQHLLQELAAYDLHVDLVTSSRTRGAYEVEQFAPRVAVYKVPVDNRNIHHSTNRELLRYTWRGLAFSRSLVRRYRYDLAFAFAGVPAGAMAWMLKASAGIPYVVSLQGPDVPGFEERYGYLYPALKPLLRRIWRGAAQVIAISREHRALAQQTMPDLNISIIHNGVDTSTFAPPVEGRRDPEVNILCVGRLIERKGQHHLLHAFAHLRGRCKRRAHLTLVGTGDAEKSLQSLAAGLGISQAVTFTGFVARDGMPAVYRAADVFVLPSQNEGMSIALLEAMASALPVVVTDVGGTAELVEDGVNGMVVPWADATALSDALVRLVDDAPLRTRLGLSSRMAVAAFGWPQIAETYAQLFSKVAGKECRRIT